MNMSQTLGQVLVIMRSNGHLSQGEFDTAIEKLKSFGIEEPSAGEESELKPLFLDRIALEYLHKAGVLTKSMSSFRMLYFSRKISGFVRVNIS